MEFTVRVEGKIYWDTMLRKYVFDGKVFLPASNLSGRYHLPPFLQNKKYGFFGEDLTPDWGHGKKTIDDKVFLYREFDFTCRSYDLVGDTPEEVEEKLKKLVDEQVKLLKEIKEENVEKAKRNKNVVLVYTI